MKTIFFDTGTLISLSNTCTLNLLKNLKEDFNGDFYITKEVYEESIGKAERIKRFKYEGVRLKRFLDKGILTLWEEPMNKPELKELLYLMNHSFYTGKKPLNLVQAGEASIIIAAKQASSNLVSIDERTTRLFIESPLSLGHVLSSKLHEEVTINRENLAKVKEKLKGLRVLRSVEFAVAGFKKGYLPDKKPETLNALIWALRFGGCSISRQDINDYTLRMSALSEVP